MFEEVLSQHFGYVEVESCRIVAVAGIDAYEIIIWGFEALTGGRKTGEIEKVVFMFGIYDHARGFGVGSET